MNVEFKTSLLAAIGFLLLAHLTSEVWLQVVDIVAAVGWTADAATHLFARSPKGAR